VLPALKGSSLEKRSREKRERFFCALVKMGLVILRFRRRLPRSIPSAREGGRESGIYVGPNERGRVWVHPPDSFLTEEDWAEGARQLEGAFVLKEAVSGGGWPQERKASRI